MYLYRQHLWGDPLFFWVCCPFPSKDEYAASFWVDLLLGRKHLLETSPLKFKNTAPATGYVMVFDILGMHIFRLNKNIHNTIPKNKKKTTNGAIKQHSGRCTFLNNNNKKTLRVQKCSWPKVFTSNFQQIVDKVDSYRRFRLHSNKKKKKIQISKYIRAAVFGFTVPDWVGHCKTLFNLQMCSDSVHRRPCDYRGISISCGAAAANAPETCKRKDLQGRVRPEVSWIEREGDRAGGVPPEMRLKERDERHEEAAHRLSVGSATAGSNTTLSPIQRLSLSSGCAPRHGRSLMEHIIRRTFSIFPRLLRRRAR